MSETSPASEADRLFADRVVRYLDDAVSAEELTWLNSELAGSAARRSQFVELSLVQSMVAEELSQRADMLRAADASVPSDNWLEVAALSQNSTEPIRPTDHSAMPRPDRLLRIGRRGIAIAAVLLLGVGIAWRVNLLRSSKPIAVAPPVPSIPAAVAEVTGQREAVWNGPAISPGAILLPGTTMALESGCAELTVGGRTHVVVEGPARFAVDSVNGLSLMAGKLVATVSGGTFAVTTPTAVVTDLGTDFGVEARADGQTEIDVFKGSVRVQGTAPTAGAPVVLTVGQAATATAAAVNRDSAGAVPQHFVRTLAASTASSITLDIVDLFAGGDGTGHRRGVGLNVLSGQLGSAPIAAFIGKHGYVRSAGSTFIDGGFVPDQLDQPTQVDSTGRLFQFPPTDNHSFGSVWAGGPLPAMANNPSRSATLAGVDYSADGHGLLAMDSNKGVTFDLNAVRRQHPLHQLAKFHCGIGNSYVGPRQPKADVFVLVDGQLRFEHRGVSPADGAIPIDIPLNLSDRFLTLVTTDGQDGTGYDWVIWADPMLDLSAR